MGLVAAALLAMLAGCYAPALRDCAVTCATEADCAGDQRCTAGLCAAAGASCAGDAPMPDAPSIDAAPDAPGDAARLDAPVFDQLHVMIGGTGEVVVDGIGTCASGAPSNGNCVYAVLPGLELTAHAEALATAHPFDKWADPACMDQGATCVFSPLPMITIQARFK